jgi:hypothetical protein
MSIDINAEMELMAIEISQNCFSGEYAISIPPEIPLAFQGIGMRSRESLFGREDSCFLHHRLSGYAHAVWGGARWLGVWDARLGSAQRSSMGVGAVRRIRTAPTHQPNKLLKKEPRRCRRGSRLSLRKILMKSCPGWSDCSPDCPEHPVGMQVR